MVKRSRGSENRTGGFIPPRRASRSSFPKTRRTPGASSIPLLASQTDGPANLARLSLKKLADEILDWCGTNTAPDTFKWRKRCLQTLTDHLPGIKASDLSVRQAERWIDAQTTWQPNTKTQARGTLHACLNWGVRQGLIPNNPVEHLGIGSYKSTERILSKKEREAISGAVRGQEKEYLRVLELTGARPFSEIATLTTGRSTSRASSPSPSTRTRRRTRRAPST